MLGRKFYRYIIVWIVLVSLSFAYCISVYACQYKKPSEDITLPATTIITMATTVPVETTIFETIPPTTITLPTEPLTEPPTSPPTEPPGPESLGIYTLTAYCPCEKCSGPWGNMTATGTIAKPEYTVAVDPSVIPYGTKLLINGIVYVAEDCGKNVKGTIIDIYFETHEEVNKFGMQEAEVFVIEEEQKCLKLANMIDSCTHLSAQHCAK